MSGNKNYSLTIRVRKDEYLWMESAARSEDLSISSFLRRIIIKHLSETHRKPKPPTPNWILELKKERNEA